MEARSPNEKVEPDKREKREIKQEATASPSEVPHLEEEEEEEEPPPLEEVSEPHSKASTRLSSPLSEKGYSPSSHIERVRSPSSLYTEETESPSSYTENARSPSPYTENPDSRSPHIHIDDLGHEGVENNISEHYAPSPKHTDTNNSQTQAGIGSNTTTVPIEKIDAKPSMRPSIPSITHSVISAAKHVSFKSQSLSSRSSSALYGSSSWWKGSAHQMKIVEVALRFGGAVLALITFAVMAATREKQQGAGSTFTMKFTDYQAYNYLVAVNVISFVYSCCQLVLLTQSQIEGVFFATRDNKLYTYICDQVLAFLLFSASTAAATAAQLSRHGLHNIWPPACSTWKLGLFCTHADAAVVMGFFSSFFVIASSVFSGYHVAHSFPE